MSIKRIAVLAVCGVLAIALVVLCTFYFAGRRNYSPVNLAVNNDSLSSDKDSSKDGDLSLVEINADNVQSVIGTLKRPESYSRSLTVSNYWTGGSTQYDINVLAVPGKTGRSRGLAAGILC